MLFEWVVLGITGATAGFLSGFFGIGGGIILVPGLSFAFHHLHFPDAIILHLAAGTSLAIVATNTLRTAWKRHASGHVLWSFIKIAAPLAMVGAAAGACFADRLHSHVLHKIFGVVVLCMVIQLIRTSMRNKKIETSQHTNIKKTTSRKVGFFSGIFSGLLGIGNSSIVIPFLKNHHLSPPSISGTASAMSWTVACIGAVTFLILGMHATHMLPWATGYIYWPAFFGMSLMGSLFSPLGIRVSEKVSDTFQSRAFLTLLMVICLHMLL